MNAICLTPEQRTAFLADMYGVRPVVRAPLAAEVKLTRAARRWRARPPRPPRQLKRDAIIAWLLAWPLESNDAIAEQLNCETSYVGMVRRTVGIKTAWKHRNDSRRAEILALAAAGVRTRDIAKRMGVERITINGIMRRARLAAA